MKVSRVEEVNSNMKSGCRCSESILITYCEDYGLDRKTAMKLGCSLGGGLGSTGSICGAVSAAVLVIGLKFGRTDSSDKDSVAITDRYVSEFITRFEEKHKYTLCNDLIGIDRRVKEDHLLAKERGVYKTLCPGLVESAALILEDIISREL